MGPRPVKRYPTPPARTVAQIDTELVGLWWRRCHALNDGNLAALTVTSQEIDLLLGLRFELTTGREAA